jgi:hypothetical protein
VPDDVPFANTGTLWCGGRLAKRYANKDSVGGARDACAAASSKTVTLNFSYGVSLNYVLTVDVSPEGRIEAVSGVGAW